MGRVLGVTLPEDKKAARAPTHAESSASATADGIVTLCCGCRADVARSRPVRSELAASLPALLPPFLPLPLCPPFPRLAEQEGLENGTSFKSVGLGAFSPPSSSY